MTEIFSTRLLSVPAASVTLTLIDHQMVISLQNIGTAEATVVLQRSMDALRQRLYDEKLLEGAAAAANREKVLQTATDSFNS